MWLMTTCVMSMPAPSSTRRCFVIACRVRAEPSASREIDRGGPLARTHPEHRQPDFLFPQMTSPAVAPGRWAPGFVDYLYVSFTNATAFSPTDTMPLTSLSKVLMGVQSLASLTTIGIVAARAVNILS